MAVKTTKIQCNQDVDLRGKVDVEGDVTCGKNLEVDGALTINSAKDLKTKDGTSIGGSDIKIFKIAYDRFSQGEYPQATLTSEETSLFRNSDLVYLTAINGDKTGEMQLVKFDDKTAIRTDINQSSAVTYSLSLNDNTLALNIAFLHLASSNDLEEYALKTDLDTKQSTLYRHSIVIANSSKKAILTFMTESEKNTEVNSVQDLIAVFGNTRLGVSGFKQLDTGAHILLILDVGTSIDTTNVAFIEEGTGVCVQLPFTNVFGTTGFSINDTVTAM